MADKAKRYEDMLRGEEYTRLKQAADAWCAAFVIPKTDGHPAITDATVRAIGQGAADPAVVAAVTVLADEYQFLHPHLAFSDVYQQSGGFDLVVGNPPWEKVKLHEKEWFAVKHPEIAAASRKSDRQKLISGLASDNPGLYEKYQRAVRHAQGLSALLRNSGRYPLGARGDTNTYAVFAELMRNAISPSGRVAMVLPTTIATGAPTRMFFSDLVENQSIVSLYDFENRKAIFPSVHRSFKFCLLTLRGQGDTDASADFVFFADEVATLDDPNRRFNLTSEDFALLNPNTRTTPIFKKRRDAEITMQVHSRFPVLVKEGDPEGDPWVLEFDTMFHMTNDSYLFLTRPELEADGWTLQGNQFVRDDRRYLPLYEGKMVGLHDHRAADVVKSPTAKQRQNQPRYISDAEKMDPNRLAIPIYWVPESEAHSRARTQDGWLASFNDTTSATNSRTMICSAIPTTAVSYTQRLLYTSGPRHLLLAVMGSFIFDFVAKQKVDGTHFTFVYVKQMPVPPPSLLESMSDFIAPRMLELSYTAWDMADFGRGLGYKGPPFQWNTDRRMLMKAELDALMFRLYGVDRRNVSYILDTFERVGKNDVKKWGEYRTKRLILERYDVMTEVSLAGCSYESVLDPPPAHPSAAHDESTRPPWAGG